MAARWHGFNHDSEDVAKVVMMAESTIKKRLYEMRETTMAGMTKEAIMNDEGANHVSLCLPPCAKVAKLKHMLGAPALAIEDNRNAATTSSSSSSSNKNAGAVMMKMKNWKNF